MPKIHLIEKLANFHTIDKESRVYETFCWAVTEANAAKLVGGQIYFHKAQDKPSYYGGTIISYRVLPDDANGPYEIPGRIVFKFKASLDCKDIKAGKDKWIMEKKIVWD